MKGFISLPLKKSFLWEVAVRGVVSSTACVLQSSGDLQSSLTQLWCNRRTMQFGVRRLGPHPALPSVSHEILVEQQLCLDSFALSLK